jgi:predicted GIY-YIG superfamily endonuclease
MPRYYESDYGSESGDTTSEGCESSDDEKRSYHRARQTKTAAANFKRRGKVVDHDNQKRKCQKVMQPPATRVQASGSSHFRHAVNNHQAGVYVLRNTRTNVYYVGKSMNIETRLLQHREDNGNDTLTREGTMTVGSVHDLESWERNEVLTRMYRNGMDGVRGWRYTDKGPLSMEDKISARNDIMEKFDLCRRCGHNNHFIDKCFARSPAFWCRDIPMQ